MTKSEYNKKWREANTERGTNEYNNLGVACRTCNHKKHNKTEVEFRNEG
jgi:5-methylcytosine-specific restriction endonuclease McrA